MTDLTATGLPLDNTADTAKPISTATQAALDALTAAGKVIPKNTQTGTAYTLVLADAGKVVRGTNAASTTWTIPPASSVAFPADTVIELYQAGTGQITVTAGAGVTLRAPDGAKLAKQYASASLRLDGADEWVLAGNVSA